MSCKTATITSAVVEAVIGEGTSGSLLQLNDLSALDGLGIFFFWPVNTGAPGGGGGAHGAMPNDSGPPGGGGGAGGGEGKDGMTETG